MTSLSLLPFRDTARRRHGVVMRLCVMLLSIMAGISGIIPAWGQADVPENRTQVIAARASLSTWSDPLEALGTLSADESVTLSATVTGTIAELNFDSGDEVSAGKVLIRLDDAETQAQLRAAQALRDERQNALNRARQLQERNLGARANVEDTRSQLRQVQADIDAIQARLADRRLRAPFAGTIGLRNVSVGTLVTPGTELATLDKLDVMKLDFTVPATFLSVLRPGLTLSATTPSYPERVFSGEVGHVGTRIDPITRSVSVRALLPNPQRELRPGMLMEIVLERRPRQALVVPESVLIPNGERQYVMAIDPADDNRVTQREVEIGERRAGEVEIVAGLAAGELVVSHGLLKVREGDRVELLAIDDGSRDIAEILKANRPANAGDSD
ncbi:efflux RND transporter periplasmic adaptor subunit [Halomonas sp. WWR20]